MQGRVVGLFSGIGGIERGFEKAGFKPIASAEIDPACVAVLEKRMPGVPNLGDVTKIDRLPDTDILVAGFPCQPYSQAGRRDGLERGATPLRHLLRLIERSKPSIVVLENVAFIVHLHEGSAVTRVTNRLSKLGYSWAYRIVDTRAFGLPHRRLRWILVASRDIDASRYLFPHGEQMRPICADVLARGFYWTEGSSGIGWADNAVPPLKGGSTLGIPCAPAIWDIAGDAIVTPDIRDAERLQGFPVNWTRVSSADKTSERARWRLVGNAVSVPTARWIADSISNPSSVPVAFDRAPRDMSWPKAAFGWNTRKYAVDIDTMTGSHEPILSFLKYEPTELSFAATNGFRRRYEKSNLRKDDDFIAALRRHESRMS